VGCNPISLGSSFGSELCVLWLNVFGQFLLHRVLSSIWSWFYSASIFHLLRAVFNTEPICLWRGVESRSYSSALLFLFVRDTIVQGIFISWSSAARPPVPALLVFFVWRPGAHPGSDRLAGFARSGLPPSVPARLFLPARFAHRCSRALFFFLSIFGR
jgi:hypothetical protein